MSENEAALVNKAEDLSLDSSTATEKPGVDYSASEKASGKVDELLKKDAEDESLKRYKEALLGAAAKDGDLGNTSDPRRVVLTGFTTVFAEESLEDFTVDLTKEGAESGISFSMKEGAQYRLKIAFRVQHEIVSGLRFLLKVKRKMFSKNENIVMGSYGPRSDIHEFEFPRNDWLEAPSGMIARGEYKAMITLTDSDGNKHTELAFNFKITK